ncbi:MAG TPA: CHRD domain-containing protein [Solirubrobacterales bacterium]|nr:CHRD domain-containing protein [Solirubrobacterales bacterium]
MRIKGSLLLAATALFVAMIVPGIASAHGTHVKAKMSGDQVVGVAGAPNGSGTAKLHLLRNKSRVCFTVKYTGIGSRKGLDVSVYKGKRSENGALQFTLVDEDLKTPIRDCVDGIQKQTLKKITRSPRRYNVDVKTDKYPTDGAIRGQLKAV